MNRNFTIDSIFVPRPGFAAGAFPYLLPTGVFSMRFAPMVCIGSMVSGVTGLLYYYRLSNDEQAKADHLAANAISSIVEAAGDHLVDSQLYSAVDRIRKAIG